MLNFGGAIAQMKSFSSASDAAIRSARSESASAARAGELRIRSLDRQITRFGMTRDAALALRNVDTGNTQIASELTAREAQLADMHMRAASAKAAEAAAAAKLSAEHMQLAAAVRASHDAEVADALAAEKMRAATDPLYAATARLNAEIAESTRLYRAGATSETEYARQQGVLTGRLREVGTAHEATTLAAKRHGGTLTQLSFQLNDVATMAALGAPPMQIFASQAGQVFQVAQQAQGGIKGFAMQIGGLALAFSPLIAVAAVAGVAFWRFKQQTEDNAGLKKYVESLGLTHKELKKLGDVSVSTGDMLAGFGKTLQDRLGMQFSGKKLIDYLFAPDDATQIAKFVAQIYGTFVGGYKAVVEVWGMLPSALKELFVNAANGAVAAIEMIVNKSIAALNRVIGASNSLFGTKFAAIGPVDLGRITQTHAGAGRAAGVAFGKNVQAETKNAYAAMGRFAKDWASNSVAQTMKRTNEAADKLKADRTTKAPGSDAAEKLSKEQQALVAATKDYADAQVDEANKLGLTAKQLRQYADAAAIAKAPTDALKLAIRDAAAVREAGYTKLSAKDFDTNVLQPLRDELSLYGLVGPARAEAALGLEKQAFIAKNMDDGIAVATARWTEYYVVKSQLIGRDAAAESEAERIRQITDRMNEMVEVAQRAGNAMASAFGRAGSAIGDAVSILAEYQARQAQFASERTAAAGNVQKLARIDRAASQAQLETFGDMASAAKGFFKENSAGWRAVAAAEKVYRVAQLAMSLQAMVQSALETTTRVAGAAAQATAEGTAGIAAQSKLPFPFNIAAMAATGAALVAAGIAVFGGHGGASKLPSSNIGSGTVFGDSAAKSESIKNALDALKQVDTLTNQYSRQMMMSLKSIDSQIGGVTNLVLRAGNIDASAGVQTGFKSNASSTLGKGLGIAGGLAFGPLGALGGLLIGKVLTKIPVIGDIIKSLFGTKQTIVGNGLYGSAQSLGSILDGGFAAQYYSDVQKKKKAFGITTGTSYYTQYGGADAGLEQQFTLILRSFNDAIAAAAVPLGVSTDDITSRLRGFVVDIGKIDLKGLSGEEIQSKLSAVFGAAADNMASAAFPGFERFARVGEGMFETLVRVASTVEAVTTELNLLGTATAGLGIDAKVGLAGQFENIDAFSSAIDGYFQAFYTPAEITAAKTAQLARVFDGLGMSLPSSLANYRALVEAQNLSTDAGQQTYALLLQLAPAFADLSTAMTGAKSAADILSERQDLERQLLDLKGDSAALRALDLAKVDVSNRLLQQEVWAVQDAQQAAEAAEQLRQAWQSVGDSIMDEVRRIRGLTDIGGGNNFAALMGQFNAATTSARSGDQDAAKTLPGLSQALLAAAALVATSRQELDRVQAQTAASLEATYGAISSLTGAASPTAALQAAATAGAAASPASGDMASEIRQLRDELRAELAGMRADNNSANAAIAGNTGRLAKKLDDVTGQSGGDAIAIVQAA